MQLYNSKIVFFSVDFSKIQSMKYDWLDGCKVGIREASFFTGRGAFGNFSSFVNF